MEENELGQLDVCYTVVEHYRKKTGYNWIQIYYLGWKKGFTGNFIYFIFFSIYTHEGAKQYFCLTRP